MMISQLPTVSLSDFKDTLLPSFESLELHSIDKASTKVIDGISSELSKIPDILNFDKYLDTPQKEDEKNIYLPYLAYAFKVDSWEETLTIEEKKALIKQSLTQHKYKGSVWSVKQALGALDIQSELKNWNEYEGEPYHFKVNIKLSTDPNQVYDQQRFAKATSLIRTSKNKRSIFDGFELYIPNALGNYKVNGGVVWTI